MPGLTTDLRIRASSLYAARSDAGRRAVDELSGQPLLALRPGQPVVGLGHIGLAPPAGLQEGRRRGRISAGSGSGADRPRPAGPLGGDGPVAGAGPVASPLGVPDELVGEEGETVTDSPRAQEAQGLLVTGLAEETLASPEHDREDDQPQLVDEVVLHQRAHQLIAGVDQDFPVKLSAASASADTSRNRSARHCTAP